MKNIIIKISNIIIISHIMLSCSKSNVKYMEQKPNEKQEEKECSQIDYRRFWSISIKQLKKLKTSFISEGQNKKDIFLVLGKTGVGKSTAIGYLLGCEYTKIMNNYGDEVLNMIEKPKNIHKIPNTSSNGSCTVIPDIYEIQNKNIVLLDCPGFGDTKGIEQDYFNKILINIFIKNAKSIKGIILMVEKADVYSNRGNNFKELIEIMNKLLEGGAANHINNIYWFISKPSKNLTKEHVINKFIKNRKDLEDNLRSFKNKESKSYDDNYKLFKFFTSIIECNKIELLDPLRKNSREEIFKLLLANSTRKNINYKNNQHITEVIGEIPKNIFRLIPFKNEDINSNLRKAFEYIIEKKVLEYKNNNLMIYDLNKHEKNIRNDLNYKSNLKEAKSKKKFNSLNIKFLQKYSLKDSQKKLNIIKNDISELNSEIDNYNSSKNVNEICRDETLDLSAYFFSTKKEINYDSIPFEHADVSYYIVNKQDPKKEVIKKIQNLNKHMKEKITYKDTPKIVEKKYNICNSKLIEKIIEDKYEGKLKCEFTWSPDWSNWLKLGGTVGVGGLVAFGVGTPLLLGTGLGGTIGSLSWDKLQLRVRVTIKAKKELIYKKDYDDNIEKLKLKEKDLKEYTDIFNDKINNQVKILESKIKKNKQQKERILKVLYDSNILWPMELIKHSYAFLKKSNINYIEEFVDNYNIFRNSHKKDIEKILNS